MRIHKRTAVYLWDSNYYIASLLLYESIPFMSVELPISVSMRGPVNDFRHSNLNSVFIFKMYLSDFKLRLAFLNKISRGLI